MPVTINEYCRIKAINGEEFEGLGIATDLTAVQLLDDSLAFGRFVRMTKIRTTVVCDAGVQCARGKIDENFIAQPKVIEFDDSGDGAAEYVKDVADIVTTSDFRGQKQVFCSEECMVAFVKYRAKHKNVIQFPSGKGRRTFEPNTDVSNLQPLAQAVPQSTLEPSLEDGSTPESLVEKESLLVE